MEAIGSAGAAIRALAAARRSGLGQRGCDQCGGAPRPGLSVQAAPDKRVKRVLERAMRDDDWRDAGAGWQGKDGEIRLMGWSRQRRVVMLRRRLAGVMMTQRDA